MLTLAEHIKSLRGNRNYVQFAKDTGSNRQTLKDIEDGKSVLIETVKQIADACGVDSGQWLSILIAWIRLQIGDEEFAKLDIRPAISGSPDSKESQPAPNDFGRVLEFLFRQLHSHEQVEIFKAITRPAVRECLPAINSIFENSVLKNSVFEKFGGRCAFCHPSHPLIDKPEKLNSVLQRLKNGDESMFASVPRTQPGERNPRKGQRPKSGSDKRTPHSGN